MMKTTDRTNQIKLIEALIERYFDGATSLNEEQELRRILATTQLSTPAINEAKAVLGLFSAMRKQSAAKRQNTRRKKIRNWSVAASVAAIICASVATFTLSQTNGNYMTRLNGTVTDDPATALSFMDSQIAEISQSCDIAQDAMLTDFSIISESIQ